MTNLQNLLRQRCMGVPIGMQGSVLHSLWSGVIFCCVTSKFITWIHHPALHKKDDINGIYILLLWFLLLNTHKLYFWTPISRGALIDLSIYLFYCSCRYTSIGSIHDTVPNALLCTRNSGSSEEKFKPAYLLADGRLERAGRAKKNPSVVCGKLSSISNGLKMENLNSGSMLTASIITVGDEIL